MRFFLLPVSTKRSLIYCQRSSQQSPQTQSLLDKLTTKASATWISWEKSNNGVLRKVTSYGNKLFQRLPYEEWSLKSVPPLSTRRKVSDSQEAQFIEYPKSFIKQESVYSCLQSFAARERQAFHTKWLWASAAGMPISAPLAIVPAIPNLPFFYLCFRAWSHWRARSGSEHIRFLLDNRLFHLSPSLALDAVYRQEHLDRSLKSLNSEFQSIIKASGDSHPSPNYSSNYDESMLLSKSSGILIAECLGIPAIEQEVERAVHQVEASLKADTGR